MASSIPLSELVQKFVCDNCEEYLMPPISICSGGTTICGLCAQLNECKGDILGQCQILETIGSMLKFPCRFTDFGCMAYLSWKENELHEPQCPFKHFSCPLCNNGLKSWKGTVPALIKHCQRSHAKWIMSNRSTYFFLSGEKGVYFCVSADELFVLVYKFECNFLLLSLKWVGPSQQAKRRYYRLTLRFSNNTEYFERKQIEPANNTWDIDPTTSINIDLCVLKSKLQVPDGNWTQIKIDIFCRNPVYNGYINGGFIKDVECLVCQDLMTPPIFQCEVGHSFCCLCKPKLKHCPVCRNEMGRSRNFALEGICNKLNFKCMYNEDGCLFTSTLNEVSVHEHECTFGFIDCPLKSFVALCEWRGKLHQVRNHVMDFHGIKFKF